MKQQHKNISHKESLKPKVQKSISSANLNFFKEEYLRWIFVIFTTIITYVVLAWIVTKTYTPNIDLLKAEASKITFLQTAPEPMEQLLYQLGLVFIPSLLLFLYWISKKSKLSSVFKNPKLFTPIAIISSIIILFIIYYGFSADNIHYVGPNASGANEHDSIAATNFDFFFHNLFLQKHFFVYIFLIFPIILSVFFGLFERMKWDEKKSIQMFFSIATWGVVGLLLLVIIPMNAFEFPYTWQNKFDFNAVYYSMAQVYGGTPMLVDGLSNTYGLYAQLLNPVFQLTGLSVYKFSLCMAILISLCFVFQTFFLSRFTKNKFIFLLGCCSLFLLPYLDNKIMTQFDAFFAIYPIRTITFATLLFIIPFYLKKKSKISYYIACVVLSILALWNPEIGLVSFIAWIALLVYTNFYTENKKISIVGIVKNIVIPLLILVATFIGYSLIIKLSYGTFPHLLEMFKMIVVFGRVGFFMLPMALVHPWNLWALIFIIGMVFSFSKLLQKDITPKSSAIFLLSILGSGLFIYYVGRSHNWSFAAFSGVGLILLTLLGDELWTVTKNSKLLAFRILFALFVFVISVSGIELLANIDKITALKNDNKDRVIQLDEEGRIKNNQQFIKQNTTPKEKILVFTSNKYQGLYFELNKNRSGANPGFIELVLNSELDNYTKTVRDSSFKIFIEPGYFYYAHFKPICAAIACTYQLENGNGTMALLKKRANQPVYKEVLTKSNSTNAFVHEVFQDDTNGFNKRIKYALGKEPLKLGKDFSFEVVFTPQAQMYQYAVLASNQVDSAGFTLFCADQLATYYFAIAGQMFPVKVTAGEVNYIAANVSNNTLSLFVNGNPVGNYMLKSPYIESGSNFYIGNQDHMRYYLGAIQEVSIGKEILTPAQIIEHWEKIKK